MQFKLLLINLVCLLALASCESAQQKAAKLSDEGASRSAESTEAAKKGYTFRAIQLNEEAKQFYKQALQADSTYSKANSGMGHSLYKTKNFNEAVTWFDKANPADLSATDHLEVGLCRISQGRVVEGRQDIDKGLKKDSSAAFKKEIIDGLYDLGKNASDNLKNLQGKGNVQIGMAYRSFAISLFQMALEMDTTRKDIAKSLHDVSGT